jgi:hypothetical protein
MVISIGDGCLEIVTASIHYWEIITVFTEILNTETRVGRVAQSV